MEILDLWNIIKSISKETSESDKEMLSIIDDNIWDLF